MSFTSQDVRDGDDTGASVDISKRDADVLKEFSHPSVDNLLDILCKRSYTQLNSTLEYYHAVIILIYI